MKKKSGVVKNNEVSFFLNGEHKVLDSPNPDMMLIDYLRSPELDLSGPKKPCGQGGCGGCTVVLSSWDKAKGKPVHRSINSCLRPVAALNGLSVTTIEGTGSVDDEMNPVAHRLAANNGTQCGYCTNGWVMAMSGFLANAPKNKTKKDIENLFDGNLCRCTGYRSILAGMKTFASDFDAKDIPIEKKTKSGKLKTVWVSEKDLQKKYIIDPAFDAKSVAKKVNIPFPPDAAKPVPLADFQSDGKQWIEVDTIKQLQKTIKVVAGKSTRPNAGKVRIVNGNTSYGIYKEEVEKADTYIDIRTIPDLHKLDLNGALHIGAGVSYGELIEFLSGKKIKESSPLSVVKYMACRTAGTLVRNAATIGGNTMLALKHIHQGEPFPSDLFTALLSIPAAITYIELPSGKQTSAGKTQTKYLYELLNECVADKTLADRILLISYTVSAVEGEIYFAQKTALREVNSHSIVNCTSRVFPIVVNGSNKTFHAEFWFGGAAPAVQFCSVDLDVSSVPEDKNFVYKVFEMAWPGIEKAIKAAMAKSAKRMMGQPSEGFEDSYKLGLVKSYVMKAFINGVPKISKAGVPKNIAKSGKNYWGKWPVSYGTQSWETSYYRAPLSEPYIKLMAMYQAQGEVRYTHEQLPERTALFGALVATSHATGSYAFCLPGSSKPIKISSLIKHLASQPGFVELVTGLDIPEGGTTFQGMGADQPLFVLPKNEKPKTVSSAKKPTYQPPQNKIMYEGQSLAMVLADDQASAEAIAAYIEGNCILYSKPSAGEKPVLSITEALQKKQVYPDCPQTAGFLSHIWKVKRAGSEMKWAKGPAASAGGVKVYNGKVDGSACTIVAATQNCGGQLHFYMETQAAIAQPGEGGTLHMRSSTQSPKSVHGAVATTLGIENNLVGVEVPQLGGAYGGKTEQSKIAASMAAVAANKASREVHVALSREHDSGLIGRRHPYLGQFQIAVDDGAKNPGDRGMILGLKADMWGDGGAYYDCSFVVSDCIQLRVDSAYYVPNYETTIDVVRTNTAPNTAYRAFGDIQATLMLENAIEEAAVSLDMDPAELRSKNLYKIKQKTPAGQQLDYCYQREVWDYAMQMVDYKARKAAVEKYNSDNKWRKRGLCMMPLKYGSGFNLVMLEQTTALLNVYADDGTILIHQGGSDMGQGMITKLAQIAAYELEVPIEKVKIELNDTRVIPNPSSTGASTGTQYNGLAVKNACAELKQRLHKFCDASGMKYWKANSWSSWTNVISAAFNERVNLQVQANAQIPGGTGTVDGVEFKPNKLQPKVKDTGIPTTGGKAGETVNEYVGFTYNAGYAEVEVDILTGETKILRADVVYDMGKSLNPAIDVGQIEGSFVQGIGYVLTEEMVYQKTGENIGQLNTKNTWRYKPPAITTIPQKFNVCIFPREEAAGKVPPDPNMLFSSKEVGEPPMVLANAVFFAIKNAVRAYRKDQKMPVHFDMPSPASVQTVYKACRE